MGIFLRMEIAPDRIGESAWEKTYEEALRIVDCADFMDTVTLTQNGIDYTAARKSAERRLYSGELGFRVIGTMDSGANMEDFCLTRAKPAPLRCSDDTDNAVDILFARFWDDNQIPTPNRIVCLWDSKTQGAPGHIPLLAVACLFADRFPDAVRVGGDITAGQCRAAVRLANECLNHPIDVPVVCRPEALAERLHAADQPVNKQIEMFLDLYLGTLTPDIGQALRGQFGSKALYEYFRNLAAKEHGSLDHFKREFRDYLLLGLDMEDLLKMLVVDPEGPVVPLKEVLHSLFEYGVHIPFDEKVDFDPLGSLDAAVCGDLETPQTIGSLFGRLAFYFAGGSNRNIPVYVPLEEIRSACRTVFPDTDTDELIDDLLAHRVVSERQQEVYGNSENSVINRMVEKAEEKQQETMKYDLNDPRDLRRWRPGLTMAPDLEQTLRSSIGQIRTFGKEEFAAFLAWDRVQRENWFLRKSRDVLLSETAWKYVFSHVMDDKYIRRFFQLYMVDVSGQHAYAIVTGLIENPELLDKLWDASAKVS